MVSKTNQISSVGFVLKQIKTSLTCTLEVWIDMFIDNFGWTTRRKFCTVLVQEKIKTLLRYVLFSKLLEKINLNRRGCDNLQLRKI